MNIFHTSNNIDARFCSIRLQNLGFKNIFKAFVLMTLLFGMIAGAGEARNLQEAADPNQSVISGTGVNNFEAGTQVTVYVQAKYANGTDKTIGGDDFVISLQNECEVPTGQYLCQDVSGQQTVIDPEIQELMTDNGDGTYEYTYTVDIDGTITASVYLLVQGGIYSEYYGNADHAGSPEEVRIEDDINFDYQLFNFNGLILNIISARYLFYIKGPVSDIINFEMRADQQATMYMNDVQILFSSLLNTNDQLVTMQQDTYYPFRIDYEDVVLAGTLELLWNYTGVAQQIVPSNNFYYPQYVGSSPIDVTITCPDGYVGFPTYTDACSTVCGDGLKAGSEVCDDGNTADNDGCSADCTTVEPGFHCTGGDANNPDICTGNPNVIYGDGVVSSAEKCDDGNLSNGDGCSSTSKIESGYICNSNSNGVSECDECDSGYEPNHSKTECKEAKMSPLADSSSGISFGIVVIGIGVSIFAAAFGLSAFLGVFVLINFIQLLMLLPLIGAYLPTDYILFCKGFKVLLFHLFFIPFKKFPLFEPFFDELGHDQTKSYLKLMKFDSESAFDNLFNVGVIVGLVMIIHVLLKLIYKRVQKIDNKNTLQRFTVSVYEFMTFSMYIVIFNELFILLSITILGEMYTAYFSTTGASVSYVITLFLFAGCTAVCALIVWQWLKTKDYDTFSTMDKFSWIFKGFKNGLIYRSFWVVFLLRRFLLVFICVVLESIPMHAKIVMYCLVQVAYFLALCWTRPFERFIDNLVELICEAVYTILCLFLLYFNEKDRWDEGFTHFVILALMLTIITVFIIALIYLIYNMKDICFKNKSEEPGKFIRKKTDIRKVIDLNQNKDTDTVERKYTEDLETNIKANIRRNNTDNHNTSTDFLARDSRVASQEPEVNNMYNTMGSFDSRVNNNMSSTLNKNQAPIYDIPDELDSARAPSENSDKLPEIGRSKTGPSKSKFTKETKNNSFDEEEEDMDSFD